MAPTAVPIHQEDVDHLPLKLGNKPNSDIESSPNAQDIHMKSHEKTQHVLGSFRCLIADLCHQFGCGHPGYVVLVAMVTID
jgi:dihydroxyacetone synthase